MFSRRVKKRDIGTADFDPDSIKKAIHKAFLAVELGDGARYNPFYKGNK